MPAEISSRLLGTLGVNLLTIVPCSADGSVCVKRPKLILGLVLLPLVPSTEWVSVADGDGRRDKSDPGGAGASEETCI